MGWDIYDERDKEEDYRFTHSVKHWEDIEDYKEQQKEQK